MRRRRFQISHRSQDGEEEDLDSCYQRYEQRRRCQSFSKPTKKAHFSCSPSSSGAASAIEFRGWVHPRRLASVDDHKA
jgi:hypothetical protein